MQLQQRIYKEEIRRACQCPIYAQNGPLWPAWQQATFEVGFSIFHGPFTSYRLLLKMKFVTSEEKRVFLISHTYALMTSIWFSE